MSSPIVRSTFCDCGRVLNGNSIRMGFTSCGVCRQRRKYVVLKAAQVPLGQHVGEFIHNRLSA